MARWPIALACLVIGGLVGALITTANLQGQAPPAPVMPRELTSYRDIAKRILPAIVAVQAKPKVVAKKEQPNQPRRVPNIENFPGMPEDLLRKFFEGMEEMPDTPQLPQQSFGSGFIIDPKGVILTNYHVVAGADRVEIWLKDRAKPYYSTDIKGDRKNDLAIVRIKPDLPLPYLELGDSDAMEIGDRVLAAGAPFGLTGSVTAGIVSAKSRSGFDRDHAVYEDYLQTDAAINPGNSGGPLVNLEGKVIGINTAIKTRSGGWQGVGLAITSNVAKNIVDQLLRDGAVHRGYLGVQVGALDADVAGQLGVAEGSGVVVTRVFDNTPAGKAGIKAGDVIVKLGDKSVKDGRELQHIVAGLPLKKPIDVTIVRDGQTKVLPVTIEEQPENYGVVSSATRRPRRATESDVEEFSADKVGMKLSDLTPELGQRFGYAEDTKGVLITTVDQGGVASEAGLQRGILIAKIDKKPVTSAAKAAETLQKANLAKGVLLQVQLPPSSGGGTQYVLLKAELAEK
jgi:serine protease Do